MNKIKTIMAAATVATMTMTASAANATDILLYTKPGGLFDRFNQVVQTALGDEFGEVVVTDSCATAKTYLENTDQPTLALWNPESAIGDNPCELDDSYFLSIFGTADWKFCSWKDFPENNLEALLSGDVIIGAHENPVYFNQGKLLMETINEDANLVPYGGSKEYMPALVAGEVDFVFATRINDGMVCHMTTASETYNGMVAASTFSDNAFAVSGYSAALVGANVDPDLMGQIVDHPAYDAVIAGGYKPTFARMERDEQLEYLRVFVETLENSLE